MASQDSVYSENVTLGYYHRTDLGTTEAKPGVISGFSQVMPVGKEGHYGYPDLHGIPDVGGEFQLNKVTYESTVVPLPETIMGYGAYGVHHYTGVLAGEYFMLPKLATIKDGSLDAVTAYGKMKPTKPLFNGLNALVELRELPEMLRQKFLVSGLKGIPNYWIALQFGWKPLLNDVKNLFLTQQKVQDRLNWLLRHNGKAVRRTFDINDVSTDPVVTNGNFAKFQPGFVTNFYKNFGEPRGQVIKRSRSRTWASAQFRYWLPEGPQDVNYKYNMKKALFGATPSPSVIYNAIPWSWLVDWFSNVGDVLSNLDVGVASRLAADYFYVMRQEEFSQTNSATMTLRGVSGREFSTHVSATGTQVSKSRIRGDPFGFHTKQSSLSGMQLSILGALGLSKLL